MDIRWLEHHIVSSKNAANPVVKRHYQYVVMITNVFLSEHCSLKVAGTSAWMTDLPAVIKDAKELERESGSTCQAAVL